MTEDKNGDALLQPSDNDIKTTMPTEEIVTSSPSNKSWKGIVIAILVILLISSLIILAIYFTSPELFHGSKINDYGAKISFRDFFLGRNLQKGIIHEWIGTELLSYVNEAGDRKLLNLKNMNETDVLIKTYFEEKKSFSSSCTMSSDGKFIYIYYNLSANYRHSSTAQYTVYELENKEANNEIGTIKEAALQNVVWSPVNHTLAFVYNNNLYYNENPLDNSKIIGITLHLPQKPYLSYGVADWLYEEEILKVSTAYWWSPTGKNIAFMSFNDEEVDNYRIKVYGDQDELNGHYIDVRYPKAGKIPTSKNPEVHAHIYRLDLKKIYNIPIPNGIPNDFYICFVKWVDDNHLLIGWTNREQNEAWLSLSQNWNEDKSPVSWVILQEKVTNGWINMLKQSTVEPIMSDKNRRIYIILNRVTRDTEYRNIAELKLSYTPNTMAHKKWIIFKDFDFTDILFFDKVNTIYFSAILPNDPKQLHLYKADLGTEKFVCLSDSNINCTYNQYEFNPTGQFIIHSCLGPQVPTYYLIRKETNGTMTLLKTLINNTDVKEMISTRAMPKIEYKKVNIKLNATHSIDVETKMMLPITLKKEHVTQYPLLLSVYAGPSSQAVTTKFSIEWATYLVSNLNIINLQIDGRGTLNRGRQFERAIYKNIGNVEIHDQLLATEEISKLHFINKTQIGAYGWSYGGFAVGQLLGNPNNKIIRCGISVAPVTSFDYYDSAYTERYLGLKEKNPMAYTQTDISRLAKNFHKKKYLLVHGTKDDNVHFLNSAKLIRSLIAEDYDFDVMVYPDEAHTLAGGRTHLHVFRKLTSFLMNCYNKTSIDNYVDLFH